MVKAFLDVCYGVNTKLATIELVQLLDLCIFLQADRVAKAVGQNLMQIAEKNGRLWTSILFAFGHLDDPAINDFFSARAAQNQLKQGAFRYRDYLTKLDFQWLIKYIRSWNSEEIWER